MRKLAHLHFCLLLPAFGFITVDCQAQWVDMGPNVNLVAADLINGGTILGSTGSYSGTSSDDKTKVFDNNGETYFDAASANGQWVGKDLGAVYEIKNIIYYQRIGFRYRMYGGRFQASADAAFTNPVTFYTVPTPAVNVIDSERVEYHTLGNLSAPLKTRYIRYYSPNDSYCNVAEIQLFGSLSTTPPDNPPSNVTTYSGNINLNGFKLVGAKDSNKGLKVDPYGQIWVDSIIVGHQMYAHTYWGRYTESVPDYVFYKNYHLQPLTEVEKYIKKHKHLPNVPSDAAYKQKGVINIQELSLILLQKVEELTLHTIDLDKRTRALQNKNRRVLYALMKKNR